MNGLQDKLLDMYLLVDVPADVHASLANQPQSGWLLRMHNCHIVETDSSKICIRNCTPIGSRCFAHRQRSNGGKEHKALCGKQ
jgi:hypothetical protein